MKHFINEEGFFIGSFDSNQRPFNSIEVAIAPTQKEKQYIKLMFDFETETYYEGATPEEIAECQNSKVPQTLTPIQFWLSLYEKKGLTKDYILEQVNQMTEPPKVRLTIKLTDAKQYDRWDEDLNTFVTDFGITQNDLNEIFTNGINY